MTTASLARLLRDQSGVSAVEYGLLAALVAVVAVAGFDALGNSLSDTIGTAGTSMKTE